MQQWKYLQFHTKHYITVAKWLENLANGSPGFIWRHLKFSFKVNKVCFQLYEIGCKLVKLCTRVFLMQVKDPTHDQGHGWPRSICYLLPALSSDHYVCLWQLVRLKFIPVAFSQYRRSCNTLGDQAQILSPAMSHISVATSSHETSSSPHSLHCGRWSTLNMKMIMKNMYTREFNVIALSWIIKLSWP